MKRCFLLVLIFISMALGLWAQSGEESIVWKKSVGSTTRSMFSHDGKMVGYCCGQSGTPGENTYAGVIRVSDGVLLWKDTMPMVTVLGIRSMDFSKNDSLFAYMRDGDKNLYIKYSTTGANYKTIPVDSNVTQIQFLDTTRIIVYSYGLINIVDYKDSRVVYTKKSDWIGNVSKTGHYLHIPPQDYPYQTYGQSLYRIYRDSIGKQSLKFTGEVYPDTFKFAMSAFSLDDKFMVLIPGIPTYKSFDGGLPLYIYNLETLVCSKIIVLDVLKTPNYAFIDADKKHIILNAKLKTETSSRRFGIIVSLEDGSVKNYYKIMQENLYIMGELEDASSDSLHYSTGYAGGYVVLLNAVRTSIGLPVFRQSREIKVYPNPSDGNSSILTIEGISEAKSVIISDIFGRESFRSEFIQSSGNSGISFRLPSLQKGVYFISIIDGAGRKITKKLMVGE